MMEENNSIDDPAGEKAIIMESDEEVSPPTPKRQKVQWQETLINLVATQQQQIVELTRNSKMATSSSPTPSCSVTDNSTTHVPVAGPAYMTYKHFKLTDYDPDNSAYSMEEWLEDATKLKQELHVSDFLMIAKASEALKKRGYRYCCDWRPLSRTWENFCADLTVAFPDQETPGVRAYKAATLRSRDCDSLCEYGSKKLRRISRFHDKLPWEKIVSMVEYGLDHADARSALQIQKPGSDRELLQLLSEFDARCSRAPKSSKTDDVVDRRQEEKRNVGTTKTIIKGACFKCGRHGHHQRVCYRNKKENEKEETKGKPEVAGVATCSHCQKIGHTEANCWYKHGKPKKAFAIKK